jgi:hypothetical protein
MTRRTTLSWLVSISLVACGGPPSTPDATTQDGGADATAQPDATGSIDDAGTGDADAAVGSDGAASDAGAVSMIGEALACRSEGGVGGLAPGTDLQRHTIDLAQFPEARCNDGTPAVLYYRPYEGAENRDRWVIQLQGGGSCTTPNACAARWCGYMTNFSKTQMTSSVAPRTGINGDGILDRNEPTNPMRGWNRVFLRYCSSDAWSGTRSDVAMDAVEPGTANPVRFRLHFAGARIFDAAVATLRQDGAAALRYTLGGASSALPDLDDASVVLLAGASAGGAGTIRNVDRFATTLRANNTACRSGGACPLRVAALIDSILPMDRSQLDWTLTPMCTMGMLCSYSQYFQAQYQTGENVFQGVRNDDTCEGWHRANRPGEEWRCLDDSYVLLNHITTPMFVRMGQTDMLLGRNAVEAQFQVPGMGPLTMPQFAAGVRAQLQRAQDAQTLANERAMIRTAPGTFGPSCPKHEAIGDTDSVFNVAIESGGAPVPFMRVFSNWFTGMGAGPVNLVTQPGGRDSCTM